LIEIGISAISTLFAVFVMYLHSGWTVGKKPPIWLRCLTGTSKNESQVKHEEPNVLLPQNLELNLLERRNSNEKVDPIGTEYQMIAAPQIQSILARITNIINEKEKKERQRHIWALVTHRVDLILLFLFNLINIVATFVILYIGYSSVVTMGVIGTD